MTELVTAPETIRSARETREARLTVAAERRAAERAMELSSLLSERPELQGAYAPADLTVEAVRWSA